MILNIYKDSFEYSAQNPSSLIKLGIINCLFFLVFPIFLQLGYVYRINKIAVNGMIEGNDQLADFSDLISMFVDGLKVFLVYIIYLIIPFLILILSLFLAAYSPIALLGIFIALILAIIAYFLALIAIPHMAKCDDNFKSAFDVKELFKILRSISILRFILFYIGLMIINSFIFSIALSVLFFVFSFLGIGMSFLNPYVGGGVFFGGLILSGIIIGFLVTPYLSIFNSRAVGLIYNLR